MPKLTHPKPAGSEGFSLIELVIVVVIIGIIGAIAIPRMSRGSEGAAISALKGNLTVLNKAVDHYASEHGGAFPAPARIETQLTGMTTDGGADWSAPADGFAYGPYVRDIPPLPLGARKGNTKIALADAADVGWIYRPANGIIRPNLVHDDGTTDVVLVTLVVNNTDLTVSDLVTP